MGCTVKKGRAPVIRVIGQFYLFHDLEIQLHLSRVGDTNLAEN